MNVDYCMCGYMLFEVLIVMIVGFFVFVVVGVLYYV